ncbi:uncharacterized protein LOC119670880 [Teleopsis dalmanni]|uniref:uncharacterized protein LOC119670880 n=1 Tax=Teleopsis dalmanni TaxID=139649 RepID=UPI0018CCC4E4|nr:uncharacterized protein LOC119670880 [Teleopsis dalmanni]
MACLAAIAFTAVVHLIFRTSFFFTQSLDKCSKSPGISSWIFVIALLDILSDIKLYPYRYAHLGKWIQISVEIVMTVLITEFITLVMWCTFERIIGRLTKALLLVVGLDLSTYLKYEKVILGTITTAFSLSILCYALQATDHIYFVQLKCKRFAKKVKVDCLHYWYNLTGGPKISRNKMYQYYLCDSDD